jgi:hypothetical protein
MSVLLCQYTYKPTIGAALARSLAKVERHRRAYAIIEGSCIPVTESMTARQSIAALLVLISALAAPGSAQEIRGEVRDRTSGFLIPGAVISASDSAGTLLTRRASDGLGRYRVQVSSGSTTLRIVRIGFRPVVVTVPPADTARFLVVRMERLPTLLEPVAVRANSRCPRQESGAAFGLLEQIRAGLLNSVVSAANPEMSVVRVGFRRRIELKSDSIIRQHAWIDSAANTASSFTAVRGADDFVSRGFVSYDSMGGVSYYAPDAETLLSNDFAVGYCFQLRKSGERSGNEVLLAFAPAERRRSRVDIEGTVAVDTATRRLTRMEFKYAGLDRTLARVRAGGWLTFDELSDGTVFVDRWAVRTPYIHRDSSTGRLVATLEVREGGGEVAEAATTGSRPYRGRLGEMRLSVRNEQGQPAQVRIRLDSTDYIARPDSTGMATLGRLVPGPYDITVLDPKLAALGVGIPTGLRFTAQRDSTFEAALTAPTLEAHAARRCQDSLRGKPLPLPKLRDDGAWIIGKVVDSVGFPLVGAKAKAARWHGVSIDSLVPPSETVVKDGVFVLCPNKFSIGDTVQVEISHRDSTPVGFLAILKEAITVFAPVILSPLKRH